MMTVLATPTFHAAADLFSSATDAATAPGMLPKNAVAEIVVTATLDRKSLLPTDRRISCPSAIPADSNASAIVFIAVCHLKVTVAQRSSIVPAEIGRVAEDCG